MKKRLGSLECIYIIRDIYFKNTIERFIEQGEKCLFVGGGKGSSLYDYCKKGLKITFTDISQDAINCVKKTPKFREFAIDFNCCSAYELPYTNSEFDIIISTLNGSYFNEEAMSEFNRVLKQKGILIVSESTPEYIKYLNHIGRYDGKYIMTSDFKSKFPHPYVYTKEELMRLTARFQFDCLRYDVLSPKSLTSDEISEVITGLAQFLDVNLNDTPVIYYAIFRKGELL